MLLSRGFFLFPYFKMETMLIEYLLFFKSIHIVGAVAWFAGLFYLVRIFVYHVEALQKPNPEKDILIHQFTLMESRVYRIICVPALLITWIFGVLIIVGYVDAQGFSWFKANGWMHTKLLLVILLSGYQHYCKALMKKLSKGTYVLSSMQTRLLNEVPTILLLLIVMLAVYRNTLNYLYTLVGMIIFGILLYAGTKWYKSRRLS